jgi:hypothetical protein
LKAAGMPAAFFKLNFLSQLSFITGDRSAFESAAY